jgi:serine/threonine protein phosphatase PrpC
VLATDGVWDVTTVQDVSDIVIRAADPDSASSEVSKRSLMGLDQHQLDDNVTNICVFIE